ncbi:hypothetical protein NDU88_004728 [Pleurodeles waltl]|uniref:Uncharacterized protein n=1 Tax=Pleurodeles waltl TaxID=8319 RepID=A0AAV7PLS1_PLEWA|nr:hypothetical protein NDU88_004728 [Pleurodeles waltl]
MPSPGPLTALQATTCTVPEESSRGRLGSPKIGPWAQLRPGDESPWEPAPCSRPRSEVSQNHEPPTSNPHRQPHQRPARRLSRANNCCAGGAVGGSASTGARDYIPAAAPASHAACGLPCDRFCIHIRGRETREDASCRAIARFNHRTRGRPGGRAVVISTQLVGPRAAPHLCPRFGAAALDEAAPLRKQYSKDRGLLPLPTAHSSCHPLDKLNTDVPWILRLVVGPTPAAATVH